MSEERPIVKWIPATLEDIECEFGKATSKGIEGIVTYDIWASRSGKSFPGRVCIASFSVWVFVFDFDGAKLSDFQFIARRENPNAPKEP